MTVTNLLPWNGMVEMIRRAGSPKGRRQTGLFAVEGTRLVERALRAGAPLRAVLAAERFARDDSPRVAELLAGLRALCPVLIAPDETVASLTEGRDLGPVLALVQLPPHRTLADILASPTPARPPALLAAVDIVDPGNVGALTRTAHASGAAALLTTGRSDAFHPRATRISRGSIFKLPILHYPTADEMFDDLRRHGVGSVGTAATGEVPLPEANFPSGPLAVLMGNEAEGLPPAVQSRLDMAVTIPMAPGIDSFSVNAAAAIILYELSCRRQPRA